MDNHLWGWLRWCGKWKRLQQHSWEQSWMFYFLLLLCWYLWLWHVLGCVVGGDVCNCNPWSICSFHVIPTDRGGHNFDWCVFVSGSDSHWMTLGHACSVWGVACLSELAAIWCHPALGQAHWCNSLVCLDAVFYVHTLWWDQGWLWCWFCGSMTCQLLYHSLNSGCP